MSGKQRRLDVCNAGKILSSIFSKWLTNFYLRISSLAALFDSFLLLPDKVDLCRIFNFAYLFQTHKTTAPQLFFNLFLVQFIAK